MLDEGSHAVATGKCIRFGGGDEIDADGSPGLSIVTPVVFGDRGVAMIGAGNVWRFSIVGVRSYSVRSRLIGEV